MINAAKGEIELAKLFAERGRPMQIVVRTVRPANDDELQMALWQEEELEAGEKRRSPRASARTQTRESSPTSTGQVNKPTKHIGDPCKCFAEPF